MHTRLSILGIAGLVLAGCASSASEIKPAYVSPISYQSYSCSQIATEAERVSNRVVEVSGIQDERSSSDAVATGVALVVFWPAALLIKGDGHTTVELARLKGEFETLERVAIEKNCNLKFQRRST